MIDHLGITVSNIEQSKRFYLAAFHTLGYILIVDKPKTISFGMPALDAENSDPGGAFWLSQGVPTTPRVHFAFSAAARQDVDAFFAEGLRAGGVANGAPGIRARYHPTYYAAYLLDPDGYNIEAVCHSV